MLSALYVSDPLIRMRPHAEMAARTVFVSRSPPTNATTTPNPELGCRRQEQKLRRCLSADAVDHSDHQSAHGRGIVIDVAAMKATVRCVPDEAAARSWLPGAAETHEADHYVDSQCDESEADHSADQPTDGLRYHKPEADCRDSERDQDCGVSERIDGGQSEGAQTAPLGGRQIRDCRHVIDVGSVAKTEKQCSD